MAKYKVRDGFSVINRDGKILAEAGEEIDLSAREALDNALKLEGVTEDTLEKLRGEIANPPAAKADKAEKPKADK